MNVEKKPHSNSFFHKDPITCPACQHQLYREVMRFGHGRLISIDIDAELKQNYKVNKKFGAVHPYIYNVLVCPQCWFAALNEDFSKKDFYDYISLNSDSTFRKRKIRELYAQVEFGEPRTLHSALLGYFLAIMCYTRCLHSNFAQAKKAVAAIRASWCASELHSQTPNLSFNVIKQYFRFTSYLESTKHLQTIYQNKSQTSMSVQVYGPDVNKDLGFDGFLYLNSYLNLEFLSLEPVPLAQYKRLERSRYTLSKVFGFGKTSQQKPSILTNKARNLYKDIKDKLEFLQNTHQFSQDELAQTPQTSY